MNALEAMLINCVNAGDMKKGQAILWFINGGPVQGKRFSEITKFICDMNGRDYLERENVYELELKDGALHSRTECRLHKRNSLEINGHLFWKVGSSIYSYGKIVSKKEGRRINRGYGCTWLVGSWKKFGLLEKHCVKGTDGRWRVKGETADKLNMMQKFVLTPQRYIAGIHPYEQQYK